MIVLRLKQGLFNIKKHWLDQIMGLFNLLNCIPQEPMVYSSNQDKLMPQYRFI